MCVTPLQLGTALLILLGTARVYADSFLLATCQVNQWPSIHPHSSCLNTVARASQKQWQKATLDFYTTGTRLELNGDSCSTQYSLQLRALILSPQPYIVLIDELSGSLQLACTAHALKS